MFVHHSKQPTQSLLENAQELPETTTDPKRSEKSSIQVSLAHPSCFVATAFQKNKQKQKDLIVEEIADILLSYNLDITALQETR